MAKQTPWLLVAAAGVGIYVLSRRAAPAAVNGNGNGLISPTGVDDSDLQGFPTGVDDFYSGPANVRGVISRFDILGDADPMNGYLHLGAHKVQKYNTDTVTATVKWQQNTISFQGAAIAWPVRIFAELGHQTGFGWGGVFGDRSTGGWDTMTELLGSGGYNVQGITEAAPGAHETSILMSMGAEYNFPQVWDVRVRLEMQGTTATGKPDGVWHQVAQSTHKAAINNTQQLGQTAYAGGISSIGVSNRGYNMRRLGLAQERPPWGMALPEVRTWPRSNRNPNLPGVDIRVRQMQASRLGPGRRLYAV